MHRKEEVEQELNPNARAGRSEEATSVERPAGRHRAVDPARPERGRIRSVLSSGPVRLVLAAGVTCCLGVAVFTESRAATVLDDRPVAGLAERAAAAEEQPASRSTERAAIPTPLATATPGTPTPSTPVARPTPTRTKPAKPAKPAKPDRPRPVAGLTQAQMDNAHTIVKVGRELDVPRKGLVVAVATAMQESNLYNLASGVLPESQNYPNQGVGWDHDSVGLFQQRPSSGWGVIADLMRPAYAAERFYRALLTVPGWQQLSVTTAAQTVQVSAFPDAYARHEGRAYTIVEALLA